jgi:hypothetical protein
MLCVACGEKMRLVQAIPDDAMLVPGYEHHILECLGCGETEQRLVFRHAGEAWTDAPTTQPSNDCDEAECADAPDLAAAEPTARTLTIPVAEPAEPEWSSGNWQHRTENVRARLDDLRKRAELANQDARAAQKDAQERQRFTLFWDELAVRKPSS